MNSNNFDCPDFTSNFEFDNPKCNLCQLLNSEYYDKCSKQNIKRISFKHKNNTEKMLLLLKHGITLKQAEIALKLTKDKIAYLIRKIRKSHEIECILKLTEQNKEGDIYENKKNEK